MAANDHQRTNFERFKYSFLGHLSGISYLPTVTKFLEKRKLPFYCDRPTEALGNCFPYAVMQQLHRPEIRETLSDEMKVLSQNYYNLRKAIIEFVKNTNSTSEYYELIDEARDEYAITIHALTNDAPNWDQRLQVMSRNGSWFNEQFIQFTAWFLKRDIVCYTMNSTMKFCASSTNRTGNFQPNANCNCSAAPLHIANIKNTHFQSLLPKEVPI